MTPLQLVLMHGIKVCLLAVLLGLIVTRRYRLCWSFVAYLGAQLVATALWSFWPATFYNQRFWVTHELTVNILILATGVEIAFRVFRSFPGARPLLFLCALVVATVTGTSLIGLPRDPSFAALLQWHPRILTGAIWMMTVTAAVAAWYRLPLNALHRGILLGIAPYLFVFTTLLGTLARLGCDLRREASAVDVFAYLCVALWWTYVAWRPYERVAIAPEILRRLRFEEA